MREGGVREVERKGNRGLVQGAGLQGGGFCERGFGLGQLGAGALFGGWLVWGRVAVRVTIGYSCLFLLKTHF